MEEQDIRGFSQSFLDIENEIGKLIIGQKEMIRMVLVAVVAGGNVLLEGMPGLGKTQLVKAFSQVLDLHFSRIQFTPDLMPADVTGTNVVVKNKDGSSAFTFRKGPIFSNIVLADEINRATPKTQSALLEAMQEKTVTVGNETYRLEEPFFVLATQNPIEQEGTYPLPEAQMDRFMFKLQVLFPSKEELKQIVGLTTGTQLPQYNRVCGAARLLEMREMAKQVPAATAVLDYIMDIVTNSHPQSENAPQEVKRYVRYGASPRAAQAVVNAARIYALVSGRFNVSFDDVRAVAPAALGHRLMTNFEALSDGISVGEIVNTLLNGVK